MAQNLQSMAQNLQIQVAGGEHLDVRAFNVDEEMNTCFSVSLLVHAANPDVDFDAMLGQDASFTMMGKSPRTWKGIVSHVQQEHAEEHGLSTYRLTLVPRLWLLTQRRNHRIFQQLSEVEIVQKILGEWGIVPTNKLGGQYKKRKYKVQYGETDFNFVSRMLEDVGVSFYFEQEGNDTKMVLADAPQQNALREGRLPWKPQGGAATHGHDHISSVELKQQVRPGAYTVQDHDYRKPATYKLKSTATGGLDVEQKLERYHYDPGAFLYRGEGGDTPTADDKGACRSDEKEAARQTTRRLASERAEGKRVAFSSNAFDLAPGVVYAMVDHPRADLCKPHLCVASSVHGNAHGDWQVHGQSVAADEAFHPPLKTEKPKTQGIESATVVGPAGEEIHTDEFGRVRVQFHWDREGKYDDNSSCWMHVNQPWGGTGYGGTNLPRIGQEVLVDFLGGDPDRPVILGRVYTALQPTPYKLPANKTQSGWKSNSTGGGGGFNEIKFEDSHGKELFSTQAERDYQGLVKHDSSTLVGNDRTHTTVGNNTETVQQKEKVTVLGSRAVTVMDTMSHWVQGDTSHTSDQGNTLFNTAKAFASQASNHLIQSSESIELRCGGSRIVLTPDKIVIDGPLSYLNPGSGK
jgi:type VI secretion system secreted protein VgrG